MMHETSVRFLSGAAWPKVRTLILAMNVKEAVPNGFLIGGRGVPESLVATGERNQLAQSER